jgi:hypothetical protein
MCVIIVKKAGVKMPGKELLKDCWNVNPDGAGFMYRDGARVFITKGFMSFKTFYTAFKTFEKTMQGKEVIIHFRIATHGSVAPSHCHPFAIGNMDYHCKELNQVVKQAFAHNGIIPGMDHAYLSDSMLFNQVVLSAPAVSGNLHETAVQYLIERSIGHSKLAIFAPELILIGDFLEDRKTGLLFSNKNHEKWGYEKEEKQGQFFPGEGEINCDLCGFITDINEAVNFPEYGVICPWCAEEEGLL